MKVVGIERKDFDFEGNKGSLIIFHFMGTKVGVEGSAVKVSKACNIAKCPDAKLVKIGDEIEIFNDDWGKPAYIRKKNC